MRLIGSTFVPRWTACLLGAGTIAATAWVMTRPATPLATRPAVAAAPVASAAPVDSNAPAAPAARLVRLTAATLPSPTPKAALPAQRMIRVGLQTQGGVVSLWSPSAITLTDGAQPTRRLPVRAREAITFEFGFGETILAGSQKLSGPIRVKVGAVRFPAWQIPRAWSASPIHLSTDGSTPRYHKSYRGALEAAPQTFSFEPKTHLGPLRVVNIVALDEYLKGVVPWEMSPSAPLEALKAQALCARSETLAKIESGRHRADGFDICDYDHCQGYPGTDNEKPASTLAVEQTRGLAIYYKGRIADAVYGTNSGGITANAGDVWKGNPPYMQSVRDVDPREHPETARLLKPQMSESDWEKYIGQPWPSFARPSQEQVRLLASRRRSSPRTAALFGPDDWPEFYRWRRVVTPAQLLQGALSDTRIEQVTEMRVLERASSGRIRKLEIVGLSGAQGAPLGEAGETTRVVLEGDSKIRSVLSGRLGSTTALPSSTFIIAPQRDASGQITSWVLKGAGWGHGVGMCQRGAQNRALRGWKARQIVEFYFSGAQVLGLGG